VANDTGELFDPLDAPVEDIIDRLDELDNDDPRAWPQLLADLVDVTLGHLQRRLGLDAPAARLEAQALILVMAEYFGGRMIYLPKNEKLRRALRDTLIWHEFTGDNVAELGRRYDLSDIQIYNVLREQRRLHRAKTQADLFADKGA